MQVLGINVSVDAAAAIVVDGVLVAAACEERFDRQKHSREFPAQAVRFCLERAGVGLGQLDAVASFWNPARQLDGIPGNHLARYRDHAEYLHQLPAQLARSADGLDLSASRYTLTEIDRGRGAPPLRVYHVAHHLCHAQLAWRLSGWDEAAVLTLDGYGERDSGVIGRATRDGIEELEALRFPHSLGSVYAAITQHLGYRANSDEGTIMGLAAHADPTQQVALAEVFGPCPERGARVDLSYFDYYLPRPSRVSQRFVERFGPGRRKGEPITDAHRELAASLQAQLELCVLHLARRARELTGLPRLVYAGGVALNSVANGLLAEAGIFDDLFVPPAAGDAGTSAGAALWVHEHLGGAPAAQPTSDALGPDVDTEEVAAILARSGLRWERLPSTEAVALRTAERVAQGAVVGWYQGRMEFGPRALGQRSLIADPRHQATFDRLNREIKFRESFRPYAPAVLAERVGEWFDPPLRCPYMLKVLRVREEQQARLAAVTHVDGTARVQTVDADEHPLYHRMIARFGELTGVPVVLNTSFNIKGAPIVCRPGEAIEMLCTTGLDALAIGPFWVEGAPA